MPTQEHGFELLDKRKLAYKTAAYTMLLTDLGVVVVSGTVTITLPSVALAAGMIFTVHAPAGGTATVTVADNANDAGLTNISLDADDEYVCLYSDGRKWCDIGGAKGYS